MTPCSKTTLTRSGCICGYVLEEKPVKNIIFIFLGNNFHSNGRFAIIWSLVMGCLASLTVRGE